MFIQNKYTKWYYSIIYKAKARENLSTYKEKHHIIPKCLGGSNEKSNLAVLTAKEHFVCHLLLTKMTTGAEYHKMVCAATRMATSSKNHIRYKPGARTYQTLKEKFAKEQSIQSSGMIRTPESNAKRSATLSGRITYIRTKETNAKLKETKRNNPQIPWNKGKTTSFKGKTYEEMYGLEKATKLKKIRSVQLAGKPKSDSTKKLWSTNRKGKTCGGLNSNACPITIDGIRYDCKASACEALGISLYKLNKLI
jgi:hypothetical protein